MAMTEYTPPTQPWIDVVYEDDNLLAVNKPAGLLSVPGRLPEHYDSMWSRIVERDAQVQVIHRLDMATSGLMLLAKDKASESALKKQFQYRLTHKVYYARVWGHPPAQGEVARPLICDWPNRPRQKVCEEHGKPSLTRYEVVAYEAHTSVVRLLPVTGRSHQLRVHMQVIGHPIVGDEFYAHPEALAWSERLQLHAAELSFYHPVSHRLASLFVPCDFYPNAVSCIFECFSPSPELPDYKTLPKC